MNFENFYRAAQAQAIAHCHRQLLWLSGEQQWCYAQLQSIRTLLLEVDSAALLSKQVSQQYFDTAQQRNICRSQLAAKDSAKFLGQELQAVVFDGYSGFNPDSLAIISGTLVAGSVLILLTPDTEEFGDWQEPEMDNLWVQPYQLKDVRRHFLAWLKTNLAADTQLLHFSTQPLIPPQVNLAKRNGLPRRDDFIESAQAKQGEFVKACYNHLTADGDACAVLTAARGRGKSAALGLLASLFAEQKTVYLTAWTTQAVLQVIRFCDYPVQFLTPLQLLAEKFEPVANSLLLIDEAAALSVDVLLQLSAKFPQCVYSSTTQGYEGTGQGFKLRFLEYLSTQNSQCRFYHLDLPMRWAANDPVENWLNEFLLLNIPSNNESVSAVSVVQPLHYSMAKIDVKQLLEQPSLMRQLYTLLAQAHYRTTPSDLRIILDSPNTHLWLVRQNTDIVAVCLVALEGAIGSFTSDSQGLDGEQLSRAIYRGQRRPRGNLIPQILIAQEGVLDAKRYKFARIVRIATHFSHRRAALATQLLAEVERWASERGIDYLGANFSIQNDLLKFWQKSGFSLLRIGSQQDKITASYNALMLKSVVGDTAFVDTLADQLPFKLAYQQQRLFDAPLDMTELRLVASGLNHQQYLAAHPMYLTWCIEQLHCFAYYYRSLESIGYILLLLLQKYPLCWHADVLGKRFNSLLDGYFIKQLGQAEMGIKFSLSGYRSLVKELRQATGCFVVALEEAQRN